MSYVYLPGLSVSSDSGDWSDPACDAFLIGGGCIVRQSSKASAFCSSKTQCAGYICWDLTVQNNSDCYLIGLPLVFIQSAVTSAGVAHQNAWIKRCRRYNPWSQNDCRCHSFTFSKTFSKTFSLSFTFASSIAGAISLTLERTIPSPTLSSQSGSPSEPTLTQTRNVSTIPTQVVSNSITFHPSLLTPVAESRVKPSITASESNGGVGGGATSSGGMSGAALGAAVGLPLLAIAAIDPLPIPLLSHGVDPTTIDHQYIPSALFEPKSAISVDRTAMQYNFEPLPDDSYKQPLPGATLRHGAPYSKALIAGAAHVSMYPGKEADNEVFTWDKFRIMDWLRALQFSESVVIAFYEMNITGTKLLLLTDTILINTYAIHDPKIRQALLYRVDQLRQTASSSATSSSTEPREVSGPSNGNEMLPPYMAT
ncbi:hypothetical protein BC829DRAFT_492444 [Chytridium lagenaria]|nr:hypothetical protein BC829DRAFT_492444 [Chytridium lagenaria]